MPSAEVLKHYLGSKNARFYPCQQSHEEFASNLHEAMLSFGIKFWPDPMTCILPLRSLQFQLCTATQLLNSFLGSCMI